jgi:hypothetical protein
MIHGRSSLSKLEEARRLDGEICDLHRKRNQLVIEIAERLEIMEACGLAGALGFANVTGYAERKLGYSSSKTRALIAIARHLRELPVVREAAVAGDVPWTKLRHVVAVATPETQGLWLEKARRLSNRELERAAVKFHGEDELEKLTLELTPQQVADIEEAARAVWKEQPKLSFGAAVAEACRRAVAGGVGGSKYRVVVTTCADCGAASRETRDGPVEVAKAELERVKCDAEVVDVRHGPGRMNRTIPPRTKRFVEARDGGRCRVPGCVNRAFVEIHHEGGFRRVGHDPARMLLLCSSHHGQRHDGQLRLSVKAGEVEFALADGTPFAP